MATQPLNNASTQEEGQADFCRSQVSLDYKTSSRPARATHGKQGKGREMKNSREFKVGLSVAAWKREKGGGERQDVAGCGGQQAAKGRLPGSSGMK